MSDTARKAQRAAENFATAAMPLRTPRSRVVWGAVALGAIWRLALIPVYWGWEESDYGDLAMIRGVLDARFLHYDMNHLPGYYALGAAALALVGDTVLASLLVSLAGGLIALGLAVSLADRVLGRRVALATAALLIFQPEFALYSASAMREPVYGALLMGVLASLFSERLALASALAGGAFLMRMDGAAALAPVLLLHALGQGPRPRRLVQALAPFLLAILGWSFYCRWDHGTFLFWADAVAVNVATGGGAAPDDRWTWLRGGLGVVAALGGWLLPWRIGWGVWLGLLLAAVFAPWRRHGPGRTWVLLAGSSVGVWLGMGLTAQHGWNHNLYWKWLCGIVPVIVPLGFAGLDRALERLQGRAAPRLVWALLVAVVVQALTASLWETRRQVDRSAQLYKPQVLLARWIEANVPEQDNLILDNIPSCWINRNPMSRRMITWMDVPTPDADADAFAAWLKAERIRYALFFQEDWTEAPLRAPFLAQGGTWAHGGVTLTEVAREDDYGWIFYTVTPDGQRPPPAPDPAALGAEP